MTTTTAKIAKLCLCIARGLTRAPGHAAQAARIHQRAACVLALMARGHTASAWDHLEAWADSDPLISLAVHTVITGA